WEASTGPAQPRSAPPGPGLRSEAARRPGGAARPPRRLDDARPRSRGRSGAQRAARRVDGVVAGLRGQVEDALDEAPDPDDRREEAERQHRDEEHRQADAGVAQVEPVDAEAAHEDAEQAGGEAGLRLRVVRGVDAGLAVRAGLAVARLRVPLLRVARRGRAVRRALRRLAVARLRARGPVRL